MRSCEEVTTFLEPYGAVEEDDDGISYVDSNFCFDAFESHLSSALLNADVALCFGNL